MFPANSLESMPVVRENAVLVLFLCMEGRVECSVVGITDEGLERIVVRDGVGE